MFNNCHILGLFGLTKIFKVFNVRDQHIDRSISGTHTAGGHVQ